MSRSRTTTYTAADRYIRRATRRQSPKARRQGTRAAILSVATREA